MPTNPNIPAAAVLASSSLFLAACAEEEPLPPPPPPSPELLGEPAPTPPPAPPPPSDDTETQTASAENPIPERTLEAERESRSTLGRTRDGARDLRNNIVGGADRDDPVAATTADEHYLEADTLVWNVPLDWDITIPSDPAVRSSARIPSPLGDANIRVTTPRADQRSLINTWRREWINGTGGPANIRTETITVDGLTVTLATADGTYTGGRGNESPFWSLRAAIVDRGGDQPAVLTLIGPEDTVRRAEGLWRALIDGMRQR